MFLIKQCTTPSKVDMNLSVATFVDETVQDNKVFAEKKYSGKRVGITGCFTKAENTNSDLYVYIEDCNAWLFASTVSGSMKKSQRDKIARLTKGQNIRLECDVKKTATFLGSINLRLKNCTIPDSY